MSETPESPAPPQSAAPDTDDYVEARWTVTVLPGENVSIHFSVRPTSAAKSVTSVTASFAELKDGMVLHDFAGATMSELIAPREGQGLTGDVGADTDVFGGKQEGLAAILSGVVLTEEGPRNFFFSRPFDPTV